MHTETQWHSS